MPLFPPFAPSPATELQHTAGQQTLSIPERMERELEEMRMVFEPFAAVSIQKNARAKRARDRFPLLVAQARAASK